MLWSMLELPNSLTSPKRWSVIRLVLRLWEAGVGRFLGLSGGLVFEGGGRSQLLAIGGFWGTGGLADWETKLSLVELWEAGVGGFQGDYCPA